MIKVTSINTYFGNSAERTTNTGWLPGDSFVEEDTGLRYTYDGAEWQRKNGIAPGSDTQVLFNDGGLIAGDEGLTFDKSNNNLRIRGAAGTTTADAPTFAELIVENNDDSGITIIAEKDSIGGIQFVTFDGGTKTKAGVEHQFNATAGSETLSIYAEDLVNLYGDNTLTNPAIGISSGIVFNPNGKASTSVIDTRFESVNYSHLLFIDTQGNEVEIGTDTAGSIAKFSNSGVVINNEEADRNLRIATNGETNTVFVDGGNNNVGVGTGSPASGAKLHVIGNTYFQTSAAGITGLNRFYNSNTTDGNGILLNFDSDTTGTGATTQQQIAQIAVQFDTHDHATRSAKILFRPTVNGAFKNPAVGIANGMVVGSPTGGYKGDGSGNFAADIYKNNSAYTNPDYVLELWANGRIVKYAHNSGARDYRRLSLHEVESHIRKNHRLPGITDQPMGMFARGDFLLEKVEELFTHVIELNHKLEALNG